MATANSTQMARTSPGGGAGPCLIRTDELGASIRTLNWSFVVPTGGAGTTIGDFIRGVPVPANIKVLSAGAAWDGTIGDSTGRIRLCFSDGTAGTLAAGTPLLGATLSALDGAGLTAGCGTIALGMLATAGCLTTAGAQNYFGAAVCASLTGQAGNTTLYAWLTYVPIQGV